MCDGKHKAFTLRCGAGAQVLEPNTLIEVEGLSANAKARDKALRLATFESEEEEGKSFYHSPFFFLRKLT